ncbi:hypothetical protein [Colwellia sp. RSH04]|uniref:hypothetical protein n=1 Tax=Colwellia sp. RSH04 TaxID=2305464 RepID=UPI000E58D3CC|nr:hypothetical protein [Colwellia sp. RSH04]RHW76469.1 hypothetical protein D1094_09165 [Colwellia sp. RSH04]
MKSILKLVLFFFFFPIHVVISFLARHSQKTCEQSLYDESNFLNDEIEQLERELDDENPASINITEITQKKRSKWTLEDETKWQAENQRETEYYENHVLTHEYFKEKGIAPIPWDSFFGTDEWDIPSQAIYELIEKEKEGKLIIPENTEDRKRLRQNLEKEIFEYEQAALIKNNQKYP